MNANELRIGNLVGLNLADYPDNFFRMIEVSDHACVVTDHIDDKTTLVDRQYFECEELEGIPLTPEWLERFGFTYRNEHRGDGCLMDLVKDGNTIAAIGCTSKGMKYLLAWSAPLQYVHQLQNVFFALTGTELDPTDQNLK